MSKKNHITLEGLKKIVSPEALRVFAEARRPINREGVGHDDKKDSAALSQIIASRK